MRTGDVRRAALAAVIAIAGCGDEAAPALDAPPAVDAAVDAAAACVVDVPACAAAPTPVRALCEAAVELTPGAPRVGQDSATGGFGDCAASGSGMGGPSRYYRIVVPPGMIARVEAVPADPATPGLVRAFDECAAIAATASARGGDLTRGRAAVCLPNPDAAARAYVIAVSQYSGEADCLPLAFDVAIELRLPAVGCQQIE
ncbi:MAG: hypothetical protein JNK64_20375 [Myxococcales bacterium]|nr:hypothetical protein [Myxococcales bacterium]